MHNDSDVEDEESLLLWKQLCYDSHMELHVRGLSSGYCKDVHGQVGVQDFLVSHYSSSQFLLTNYRILNDQVIKY